jgi:hypothetical protein
MARRASCAGDRVAWIVEMSEEPDTKELREAQARRVRQELDMARSASDEEELAQHERRAEKAGYLRQKLEERAASERDRT